MKTLRKISAALLAAALLALAAGCAKGNASGPIRIATKPMTEQYILGEMLGLLIENNTDYKVEITKGVGGGTSNIQPAMEKGEFDLYPEYTSSGWVMVLGNSPEGVTDEEMFAQLKAQYEEKVQHDLGGAVRL